MAARRANGAGVVALLDAEFGRRTLAEWKELLTRIDAPWARSRRVSELLDDPQVVANGYIGDVEIDGELGLPPPGGARPVRREASQRSGGRRSTANTPRPSCSSSATAGRRSMSSRTQGIML